MAQHLNAYLYEFWDVLFFLLLVSMVHQTNYCWSEAEISYEPDLPVLCAMVSTYRYCQTRSLSLPEYWISKTQPQVSVDSDITEHINRLLMFISELNIFTVVLRAICLNVLFEMIETARAYGWYSNRMGGDREKLAGKQMGKGEDESASEGRVIDIRNFKPKRIPQLMWRETLGWRRSFQTVPGFPW